MPIDASDRAFIIEEYLPPHSIEAEISTLGAMLLSERAADEVALHLSEDDFYRPAHRQVFAAIKALQAVRRTIDLVTVRNELEERKALADVGGIEYLIQMCESTPSAASAMHYAQIVADKATLRRLEAVGHDIVKLVRSSHAEPAAKVDDAERLVFEIARQRGRDFQAARALTKEFFAEIDQLYETGTPTLGVPSGFYDIDEMTGGFYETDLIILAARPSMGKSSLMLNFALNVARRNTGSVALFSLEMGGKQLVRRMISMLSGVSMSAMKRPKLEGDDYQNMVDACETLYSLPLYIDDSSGLSPIEMRGKCRRLSQEGKLSLVIVDYLQLMSGPRRTENRVQEISDIARSLKALAKELDVPVIALSQLNRAVEGRTEKRPLLSDLRESGSIEAEADLVMMIYRESYYRSREPGFDSQPAPSQVENAEIILAKHRNGPTGTVTLGFQPGYARFVNLKR